MADDLDADFNGSGGSYALNEKTWKMEPEKDQTLSDPIVQSLKKNIEENLPVILIIGQCNSLRRKPEQS